MLNISCFFGDLNQVFLNRTLAPTEGAKDGTLTLRAVTVVHLKNSLETSCNVFSTL